MRIFLDTNVLLDAYLSRAGASDCVRVIRACGEQWNQGFVAVHTVSNAFYLITKQRGRTAAWEFIHDVLTWAIVPEIGNAEMAQTQHLGMNDFEDALQIVAAEGCGADVIVTRNLRDFLRKTALRIVLPEDFQDRPHP